MEKIVKVIYPNALGGGELYYLKIPSTDDHTVDLETVFRYMNHVDGSSIEDQLNSFRTRSMMVGDKVEIDEVTYKCESIGWSKGS